MINKDDNNLSYNDTEYKFFSESNESKILPDHSISRKGEIIWLHGTTSATLALIKQANMKALIPTGVLRKKYNLVPICGELGNGTITMFGSRKLGINYEHISGMRANAHGINIVLEYAKRALKFDLEALRKSFNEALDALGNNFHLFDDLINVKRFLKYLELTLMQLILVDANFNKDSYHENIQAIKQKIENRQTPIDLVIVKYLTSILQKVSNQPSYLIDKEFINLINNQFPIILASSNVSAEQFSLGVVDEFVVKGEISLEKQIQFAFTEANNIDVLKKILADMHLPHIEVLAFSALAQFISSAEKIKLAQKQLEDYATNQNTCQRKTNDDDKIIFSLKL